MKDLLNVIVIFHKIHLLLLLTTTFEKFYPSIFIKITQQKH